MTLSDGRLGGVLGSGGGSGAATLGAGGSGWACAASLRKNIAAISTTTATPATNPSLASFGMNALLLALAIPGNYGRAFARNPQGARCLSRNQRPLEIR